MPGSWWKEQFWSLWQEQASSLTCGGGDGDDYDGDDDVTSLAQ